MPVASTLTRTSSSRTIGMGFSLISTVIAFKSVHVLFVVVVVFDIVENFQPVVGVGKK